MQAISNLAVAAMVAFATAASAQTIDLGSAAGFAVLGGSTVTNSGPSVVTGSLGVAPGSAITGFPPGVVLGTIYAGGPVATLAQTDLAAALVQAAASACDTDLSGQDLGGLTLLPGIYCFDAAAQLTGVLTLDSSANPGADFLFRVGSALTTASGSAITFLGGAGGDDLVFALGSSATLGSGTAFAGSLLAATSVTLDSGASIRCGRALARDGAVTLDSNIVSVGPAGCGAIVRVSTPAAAPLFLAGLLGAWAITRRRAALG